MKSPVQCTVAGLLAEGRAHIAAKEARRLLAAVLEQDEAWLLSHDEASVADAHAVRYRALLRRRAAGEPLAYLLGWREFYGRRFRVTPAVLIPRPESETLIDAALGKFSAEKAIEALDLGTGSGCLAITLALERRRWRISAVDSCPEALAIARENARDLGAEIEFLQGDWYAPVEGRRFDLIVANPPYVAAEDPHLSQGDLRFEPHGALTDGADGLRALSLIIAGAPHRLTHGGWLFVEHGYDQADRVASLMRSAGFRTLEARRDLAGFPRVLGATMSE
ncbi:MAG: peptide chain release factor N(5)-glutamine methyltransferase [Rhodocyclaceae bacterium]|nr:peptide chain release factor N(5)-glutamine methyltransferase [Rhodocyclaceae bacterium]